MKDAFDKSLAWWKKLPWYWKILGCGVLIGLALLWVFSLMPKCWSTQNLVDIDNHLNSKLDAELEELKTRENHVSEAILQKKKAIFAHLNQAEGADLNTWQRREQVANTNTMEELDKLQKDWDL